MGAVVAVCMHSSCRYFRLVETGLLDIALQSVAMCMLALSVVKVYMKMTFIISSPLEIMPMSYGSIILQNSAENIQQVYLFWRQPGLRKMTKTQFKHGTCSLYERCYRQ